MGLGDWVSRGVVFVGAILFVLAGYAIGMLFAASVAPTPEPIATPESANDLTPSPRSTLSDTERVDGGSTDDPVGQESIDDGSRSSAPTPTPTLIPEASATPTPSTPTVPPNVTVSGDTRQFTFEIAAIDSCGSRCRDVEARLLNTGDAVRNVTVHSTLYAGGAGDDEVWSDSQFVGSLAADSLTMVTSRIVVSYLEGAKLCGADRVTMVTTVESLEHEQTFTTHPAVC
jgi:hypothetical protein